MSPVAEKDRRARCGLTGRSLRNHQLSTVLNLLAGGHSFAQDSSGIVIYRDSH